MLSSNLKTFLDRRLWDTAKKIITHYRSKGYTVRQFEAAGNQNKYKTHLICRKGYESISIEIREQCNIETYFEKFIRDCQANRISVKIYFAVPEQIEGDETVITHAQRNILKLFGIGLLVVGQPNIVEDIGTISCNRRFALEQGSSLGNYRTKIDKIIEDYNFGNCLNAVRNLCDEVEGATISLAVKAANKGRINISAIDINNNVHTWDYLISCLSADSFRNVNQTRFFDPGLSNSIRSFKDVRNLSDHNKKARELRILEQRYPEAMLAGIRLLRDLVRIKKSA